MNRTFLSSLAAEKGLACDFVGKMPGVDFDTDREATLATLQPFHAEAVASLGFDWSQLRRAEQIHDRRVALVDKTGGPEPLPKADALISGSPGVLLGIYVADCAAVHLVDPTRKAVGLAHSGKRGTELHIVPECVRAMHDAFGSQPADLIACLSPCIRPPHYEVDIATEIIAQLRSCGLQAGRIHDSGLDTASDPSRFYSYRREKGATGRHLALLGYGKNRPLV